jgi:integrating conjugative element protein (TIGR03761 family)
MFCFDINTNGGAIMQTTTKASPGRANANGTVNDSMIQGLEEMMNGAAKGSAAGADKSTRSRNQLKPLAVNRRNLPGVSGEPAEKNINLPPSMNMGAKLKLHTHLAINLFRGRRGDRAKNIRPIVGISLFAGLARTIWFAARDDDPYADMCLVEIERVHGECKECLDRHERALSELIDTLDGLEVSIQTCEEPLEIELNFSSPWSYRTVLLLLQYDRIVRLGLTARHVGFIGDQEWHDIVSDSGRNLRNLLGQVDRWIMTGVTRDDIRKNTAIAKRAQAMYATKKDRPLVLREDVLEGIHRARISPKNEILEKYLMEKALLSGNVLKPDDSKKTSSNTKKSTENLVENDSIESPHE